MIPVLLVVTGAFAALLLVRLGGAERQLLMARWPSLLLAVAALFALVRGAWGLAIGAGALAAILWRLAPFGRQRGPTAPPAPDPRALEARAILGVTADASDAEVRRAYRAKMARAHPDRGGRHDEAARLTAARDYLLRKRR